MNTNSYYEHTSLISCDEEALLSKLLFRLLSESTGSIVNKNVIWDQNLNHQMFILVLVLQFNRKKK